MTSQTIDQDYFIDSDTIVDQCSITLPSGEDVDRIRVDYMKTCRTYFKKELVSCDYPDYPDYFRDPFKHLYYVQEEGDKEGIFDLDSAFDILDQMLDEHIYTEGDTVSIVGSALQDSYNFFEKLLEIAVTSGLFPVKQFIVSSNDYEGSDHWVTIYECQEGEIKSVYCNG
jgi:hypothetical protein